jgi:hypothetical protein
MATQYVATDKDCNPKSPQPGDTEITDAFGNVFDNFNTDWVDYDKDNAAVSIHSPPIKIWTMFNITLIIQQHHLSGNLMLHNG